MPLMKNVVLILINFQEILKNINKNGIIEELFSHIYRNEIIMQIIILHLVWFTMRYNGVWQQSGTITIRGNCNYA